MDPASTKKMERLDVSAASSSSPAEMLVKQMLGQGDDAAKQTKVPKIGPVGRSALLDRVKMFLPQMEEANQKLAEATNPEDLDIEQLSQQHKDNYIEINLDCADLGDEKFKVLRQIDAQNIVSDSDSSSSDEDSEKSPPKKADKKTLISELS